MSFLPKFLVAAAIVPATVLAATQGYAIENCKVKIDRRDGTLLVSAKNVGANPRWGFLPGAEMNDFFNEADCFKNGKLRKCVLGGPDTTERITPPDLCTLYLADDSSTACAAQVKGCTPQGGSARLNPRHQILNARLVCSRAYSENAEVKPQPPLEFANGRAVDANGETSMSLHLSDVADLDGDSSNDLAIVVSHQPRGGSSYVSWLFLVRVGEQLRCGASVYLGDRVRIHSVEARPHAVLVDMDAHGESDGLCCPTHRVTAVYTVKAGAKRNQGDFSFDVSEQRLPNSSLTGLTYEQVVEVAEGIGSIEAQEPWGDRQRVFTGRTSGSSEGTLEMWGSKTNLTRVLLWWSVAPEDAALLADAVTPLVELGAAKCDRAIRTWVSDLVATASTTSSRIRGVRQCHGRIVSLLVVAGVRDDGSRRLSSSVSVMGPRQEHDPRPAAEMRSVPAEIHKQRGRSERGDPRIVWYLIAFPAFGSQWYTMADYPTFERCTASRVRAEHGDLDHLPIDWSRTVGLFMRPKDRFRLPETIWRCTPDYARPRVD
jgi:hypothetical protein